MTDASSTNEIHDPLTLFVRWQQGCRNLGDFAERVRAVVSNLSRSMPAFRHLHLMGDSEQDSPVLADDLSNLKPWIFQRSWNDAAPKTYSHRLADGSLSAESMGELGFSFDLGNLRPCESNTRLRISDSGPQGGGLYITLPPARAELHTVAAVRAMLSAMLPAWDVRCAYTGTLAWNEAVNPDSTDGINLPIGGITYSSEASLISALPEGMQHERWGDGVLLIITDRPDLLAPTDLQKARHVRGDLAKKGRLRLGRS